MSEHLNNVKLENYQDKLFPYAYNILGSAEDAKDAVQDILEKYLSSQKKDIENVIGYLVKGVINQSINIKNRKKKIISGKTWLPEPIATEKADTNINREEIISYAMLVLLEGLSARERAVFILKEAFDYSHKDIANTLDLTIENARKLLSRSKRKLAVSKQGDNRLHSFPLSSSYLEKYIGVIKNGDTKALERMLSEEILLAADGGGEISVVRELTTGKSAVSNLLFYVYRTYLVLQTVKIAEVNHLPALLFYQDDKLVNCQVFEFDENNMKIKRIYSVIDPVKLKSLQ